MLTVWCLVKSYC